jgi:hypothetical protein
MEHTDPNTFAARRRRTVIAMLLSLGVLASLMFSPASPATAAGISVQVVSPGVLAPGSTLSARTSSGVVRVEYTIETAPGYAVNRYFLGSSNAAPFSVQWNDVPSGFLNAPGDYRLVATAYDQSGASVRSDAPVGGIQRRTSVQVPGTFPTIANSAFFNQSLSSPTLSGGAVVRTASFGGGNFTRYVALPVAGSAATYTLSPPSAGPFDLHVSHTLLDQASGAIQIAVNGVIVAASQSFDARTSQFGVMSFETVRVSLRQGNNTITLTSLGGDSPRLVNVYAAAL